MRPDSKSWLVVAIGIILLSLPGSSQKRVGDLTTSLSGSVAPGYTATYGNLTGSTHGWTFGGTTALDGNYYSPNFFSFDSSFYLNQSRANSNFQSISNASGINANTSIFAGSHYPGSVTYSKSWNSEGNYAIPGMANYVTHGDSDTFGISWSENLPDKPSLSAGYQWGSSKYSVYGTNDNGTNSFHSMNLRSAYRLNGYSLGATYVNGGGHALIPQIVSGAMPSETRTNSDGYAFNLTHVLPMQGSFAASINRNNWDTSYLGFRNNGTIDLFSAMGAVHPSTTLSVSGGVNYSDNLAGQIVQQIVSAGGVVPGLNTNSDSHSLDLDAVLGYSPMENLQASASVERRTQAFLGDNYGMTSYAGSASYGHSLLNGHFSTSFNISDNNSDKNDQSSVGLNTTANYSSVVAGWHVNGNFGYSQNAQTLLVTYTNSFYHFSGTARHAWGKLNLGTSAAVARTALTQNSGTFNSSQSYSATVGYGTIVTGAGSYSRASGQALTTGSGLVPVPLPPPVLPPGAISLFGGNSYSFSLSGSPIKKLILSASYANADSNVANDNLTSQNHNKQFNSYLQWQYRKLYFTSGYAHLEQGFSTTGSKPEIISSYYAGVSRWFNFF